MTKIKKISLARAYDVDAKDEGYRVLVDRLWPRGLSKESLHLDEWCKSIAPTAELRKWFNHRPERWEEFRERYREELKENPEDVAQLLETAKHHPLLLLYGARDEDQNNAVVLHEFLTAQAARKSPRRKPAAKK